MHPPEPTFPTADSPLFSWRAKRTPMHTNTSTWKNVKAKRCVFSVFSAALILVLAGRAEIAAWSGGADKPDRFTTEHNTLPNMSHCCQNGGLLLSTFIYRIFYIRNTGFTTLTARLCKEMCTTHKQSVIIKLPQGSIIFGTSILNKPHCANGKKQ